MAGFGLMEILVVLLLAGIVLTVPIGLIALVVVLVKRNRQSPPLNAGLVSCPDCRHFVSVRATSCPQCGCPIP